MTFALTGKDTIIINDVPLADLGTGDVCTLSFPDNISDMEVGKNGNAIMTYNPKGKNTEVEIKVLAGSNDDKKLNSLYLGMVNDFPTFKTLTGSFSKRIGDGSGNVSTINYSLAGGIFLKSIDAKENVDGDKEQAQAIYKFKFTNGERTIA